MKLYTTPGACSLADHIALEWIGEPYEAVIVSKEERKLPAYLAINPNGAVPALDDGGWILTQNAAILNYLADLYPASKLGGDGSPRSRAEINKWLAFVNSDVHPAFKPLFGSTSYLDDAAAIEKSRDDARNKLRDLFAKIDAQLAGKDWLTGARSIADPYLYVVLRWARASEVDLSGFDNLDRFMRAMRADAGVKKATKAEGLA
ncbi:glutathione S-transferase N-terminal domain-containing protein [Lysobacter sp. CFH 32150]|uniref:glutathione S-transferase family protein n=1 Tax=Lysobacter sp. CFH 32150 TaxID=2927128 RepID=UPI001FA6E1BD|nr:glutathione S-transferase N-terminal domain-containing protein [Lysobacter sp. CFH 32150]MCI4569269.1 glutathione S-transferase N-terminal domain-containing protein [Lysobacter sp. CFH 32150]